MADHIMRLHKDPDDDKETRTTRAGIGISRSSSSSNLRLLSYLSEFPRIVKAGYLGRLESESRKDEDEIDRERCWRRRWSVQAGVGCDR